jgi:hypothetical protein
MPRFQEVLKNVVEHPPADRLTLPLHLRTAVQAPKLMSEEALKMKDSGGVSDINWQYMKRGNRLEELNASRSGNGSVCLLVLTCF